MSGHPEILFYSTIIILYPTLFLTWWVYMLPKTRLLHKPRILDILSPYSTGLESGGKVRKYNDKKMCNMFGPLLLLNLLCIISKKAPIEKFRRETS